MPVLALEADLYPVDLLERAKPGPEIDATWWALYCLPRREKQLMRLLCAKSVPFYSPLVPKRSTARSGRILISYIPLFPSYVFLYGSAEDRVLAQKTNCVSRWFAVGDPAGLTRDLRQIWLSIASGVPLTPEAQLQPGERVRVRSGKLAGLEGVVIRRDHNVKLLVAVNFLKQGASLLLDDCQLESLE